MSCLAVYHSRLSRSEAQNRPNRWVSGIAAKGPLGGSGVQGPESRPPVVVAAGGPL
ncbi:hypothetical protein BRAS3843_1600005 [Bradyrhizobium sp. STM 3843]|nr:hypothetical protein BRAS3843_1600005 [Bradyrhizobium sp. STM 3843]